jgi:leucyl aminopeptidase (aminopeptidase T)
MSIEALRSIFRVNLGVKKSDRVLVFTDKPPRGEPITEEEIKLLGIAGLAAELGGGLSRELIYSVYPTTGGHGKEPPAALWGLAFGKRAAGALRQARVLAPIIGKRATSGQIKKAEEIILNNRQHAVHAIVALSYYSTTHTTFRDFLTRLTGARYASMPLFDVRMLHGPMNVDFKALAKRTREMARAVSKADTVDVKTPNGTHMSFRRGNRKVYADTGLLTRKGAFGNLPAGEVFFAPLEGTARGKMVLEWAPTRRLNAPVVLAVKDGHVTDVSGEEDFALELESRLSERRDNTNIAELGIGTNPNATRPDNILESEKILGTVHIALGDNSTFGGEVKTPLHQDFVFFRPTVVLTDRAGNKTTLINRGKPVNSI